jgi:uncharacterized protein (DUF305 family)
MKNIAWRYVMVAFFILMFALPEWGQDSHSHNSSAKTDPSWSELLRSMDAMQTAMATLKTSGDGDVDFVKMMLPHHQAAIDMAKTQLIYGKDPQMRRLAQEIITDQQSEIELMQLWLKQHESKSSEKEQSPVVHAGKEQ